MKKKFKRCIAALLVCVILTTSIVRSQVETYAYFDILTAGFETLVAIALSVNGYSTGQMNSLHDVLDSLFISPIKDTYGFLCWCKDNPDKVTISVNGVSLDLFKDYLKTVGKKIEDFNDKAINFLFGSNGKMSDYVMTNVDSLYKGFLNSGAPTIGLGKVTHDTLDFTFNMLKSTGLQQPVKSDIYSDYVDDYEILPYKWPQTVSQTTGLGLQEFASYFEPGYFYLCGYDTTNKKYFAIPLDQNRSYVYGKKSNGYYNLVSFASPQSLRSYFIEYGKGLMAFETIMDSGTIPFASYARRWEIGTTSTITKDTHKSSLNGTTTEQINFSFWWGAASSQLLSANFSDCYIMYPIDCLDSSWVHRGIDLFYITSNGVLSRNECIMNEEISDLGASNSALAGLNLGKEELDIDSALLEAIYNRLNLDDSLTSDDIANMVAGKNKAIIDSISSSSANVKGEIEKSNGFLKSIDSTASKIHDVISDIPIIGKAITGSIDFVASVLTGIADILGDIWGILEDLLNIIFQAVVAALKFCFIPPDDFFDNWKDILEDMLEDKLDFNSYLKFVTDIKSITSAKLDDFKVTLFGKECTILTFSWYYKNQDSINDLIRGVTFLVLVFFNINQSYKMIRGTSLVKINLYSGRMGGDD